MEGDAGWLGDSAAAVCATTPGDDTKKLPQAWTERYGLMSRWRLGCLGGQDCLSCGLPQHLRKAASFTEMHVLFTWTIARALQQGATPPLCILGNSVCWQYALLCSVVMFSYPA